MPIAQFDLIGLNSTRTLRRERERKRKNGCENFSFTPSFSLSLSLTLSAALLVSFFFHTNVSHSSALSRQRIINGLMAIKKSLAKTGNKHAHRNWKYFRIISILLHFRSLVSIFYFSFPQFHCLSIYKYHSLFLISHLDVHIATRFTHGRCHFQMRDYTSVFFSLLLSIVLILYFHIFYSRFFPSLEMKKCGWKRNETKKKNENITLNWARSMAVIPLRNKRHGIEFRVRRNNVFYFDFIAFYFSLLFDLMELASYNQQQ